MLSVKVPSYFVTIADDEFFGTTTSPRDVVSGLFQGIWTYISDGVG